MASIIVSTGVTIAVSCVFIPTCSLAVGLRFYTRHVKKAPLRLDDWLMVPALILVLGMQAAMIAEVCKRLIGYPDPNFEPGHPDASTNLAFYPIEVMQIPALAITKLSFIFLFRRIFNTGHSRAFNVLSLVMIGLILSWMIAFFFSWIFICGTHPEDYWLSATIEKTRCVNTQQMHQGFSISDVILDVIIIVIPLPHIWRLHMTVGRKIAVTGIFSLGLITIAASVTRMVIFIQATQVRYNPNVDFEFLDTAGIVFSMLEVGLGLIAANLVVIYSLMASRALESLIRTARRAFSLPSSFGSSKSSRAYRDMGRDYPYGAKQDPTWHDMKSLRGDGARPADTEVSYAARHPAGRSSSDSTFARSDAIYMSKELRQTSETRHDAYGV